MPSTSSAKIYSPRAHSVTSSDDKDERKVWQVLYGYVLAFIGVVSLTPSALFVVLVSDSGVDAFTIIFFQTLFAGSVFLLYTIATSTSLEKFFAKFLNIGLLGGLASILVAIEDLTFILAVLYANVANVYIILVCNPLVAAVLSNIFMGETLPWRTIITIAVCATAIGVAVGLDLSTDLDSEWFGTLMAALSTICFASYMVTMRVALSHKQSIGEPEIELSAVLVLGFFIVVLCTIIAGSTNHIKAMTDFDYMYMLLMGAVSAPVSMTCLSYATRYISATEVGIYLLLEIILGPLWVYVAGLESIEMYAVYCGIVVIIALLTNSLIALHEERQSKQRETYTLIAGSDVEKTEDSDCDKDVN